MVSAQSELTESVLLVHYYSIIFKKSGKSLVKHRCEQFTGGI